MLTGDAELACTYACLILHDDGIAITPEKIATLVKAANVKVESYWPSLFSKLVEKRNVEDLILNASVSGSEPAAVPATAATAAIGGPAASHAAAQKEEPTVESDDGDLGFSLFD